MKKFTIAPADAADDMRRNYRREVRRHRERTQKRNRAVVIGVVALALAAFGVNAAVTRLAPEEELPKTAFEVRAEQAAKAKQATGAKTASAEGKTPARKAGGGPDAGKEPRAEAKPKSAAKPSAAPAGTKTAETKPTSTPRRTVAARPVAVAPLSEDAIAIKVGKDGFTPDDVVVAFGKPVSFFVEQAGAVEPLGFEIPSLGIQADNAKSAVNVRLGSPSAGTYKFYSYNRSIEGTLTIK